MLQNMHALDANGIELNDHSLPWNVSAFFFYNLGKLNQYSKEKEMQVNATLPHSLSSKR